MNRRKFIQTNAVIAASLLLPVVGEASALSGEASALSVVKNKYKPYTTGLPSLDEIPVISPGCITFFQLLGRQVRCH